MLIVNWVAYIFYQAYVTKKRTEMSVAQRASKLLYWMIAFLSAVVFHLLAGLNTSYQKFYLLSPFALLLGPMIVGILIYLWVAKMYPITKFIEQHKIYGDALSPIWARFLLTLIMFVFYVFCLSFMLMSVGQL